MSGEMGSRSRESSGVSSLQLVHSEINAVTSAIRKHARNTASSSFLGAATSSYSAGGGSVSSIGGPIAGGSSSASLLKTAVVSASLFKHSSTSLENGQSSDDQKTVTHEANPKHINNEDHHRLAITKYRTRLHYTYADGRRDDSTSSLLTGFTILRAQLRDTPSEYKRDMLEYTHTVSRSRKLPFAIVGPPLPSCDPIPADYRTSHFNRTARGPSLDKLRYYQASPRNR